jgi:alkylated DNA repair dioxygenase AlkB
MKITDYFDLLPNKIKSTIEHKKHSLSPETSWIKYLDLHNGLKLNDSEFEELWKLRPVDDQYIKIFNKMTKIPRKQQTYGISYCFSGVCFDALPIPDIIKPFLDYANKIEQGFFNMALVNWYNDGDDYIGFHSDDESQLINNSPIYCFSYGCQRDFILKSKYLKDEKLKLTLENNSLVIMGGTCQKTHQHSIPKRKNKTRRISITLRQFK